MEGKNSWLLLCSSTWSVRVGVRCGEEREEDRACLPQVGMGACCAGRHWAATPGLCGWRQSFHVLLAEDLVRGRPTCPFSLLLSSFSLVLSLVISLSSFHTPFSLFVFLPSSLLLYSPSFPFLYFFLFHLKKEYPVIFFYYITVLPYFAVYNTPPFLSKSEGKIRMRMIGGWY